MPIYGIDLGTTNSIIGIGDELVSELVPSIANPKQERQGKNCERISTLLDHSRLTYHLETRY